MTKKSKKTTDKIKEVITSIERWYAEYHPRSNYKMDKKLEACRLMLRVASLLPDFKFKKGRNFSFSLIKDNVSYRFNEFAQPKDMVSVWAGSPRRKITHLATTITDDEIVSLSKPQPLGNNKVASLKFHEPTLVDVKTTDTINTKGQLKWDTMAQIKACRVLAVVAIQDDGEISKQAIVDPTKKCWFHLDCLGFQGATFDLISDGEVAFSVQRYGKQTISSSPHPHNKKSVNLDMLTTLDQQIITAAIEKFADSENL